MAKRKEDKSEGLEIVSIGKIYSGPWDKKYWSSSRGKDRCPYPIGYKTSRILNGVTYKMEILEGLKGPLFTIISSDGKSCSGQTPDIALESFQKKSCSRIKSLHGKRFSCKIDGVEFFGFKNAFVQRLLRELVANDGGTAGQSSSTSNSLTEASATVHEIQYTEPRKHPDLLPNSEKPRVTGKRSRKGKNINVKPLIEANFEQRQPQNCIQNAEASNSRQRDQRNHDGDNPLTIAASNKVCGISNSPEITTGPNSKVVVENEKYLFSAERELQSHSMDISDDFKLGDLLPQETELINSENHLSKMADNMSKSKELPNWTTITEVQEINKSIEEDEYGVTLVQHYKPIVNADFCAPDTLDIAGDSFSYSDPNERVKVTCNARDDTIATDVAISEVLVTDSLPEDETGTSNASSEKSDIDSVSQEIANSMMTVLLPQALPLLKTFSRKKKKSMIPSEMPLYKQQENNTSVGFVREHIENSDLEREKEGGSITCTVNDSIVSTSGITESVVPDSFDNDESRCTSINQHNLFPDTANGFEASFQLNNYGNQTLNLPGCVNAEEDSTVRPIAVRDHEIDMHSQLQMAVNEEPQEDICTTGAKLMGKTNSSIRPPAEEINVTSKQDWVGCKSMIEVPTSAAPQMRCAPFTEHILRRDFKNVCSTEQIQITSCCNVVTENKEMKDDPRSNFQGDLNLNDKPQGLLKRVACYDHPMPISMVLLNEKENEIYICVICGLLEHTESTLFVYKALKNAEKMGFPSFVGHSSIELPSYKDAFGRDIAIDSSRLQFSPDAQSLVLLNSIKTPCCREGKLQCSCPRCTSEFSEKNAVKIVQVQTGYVTIETILRTTQGVCCLLVCEPSFLLAAEEGGKLNLWVMNARWSAQKEERNLPTLDCMLPCLVELKRIPKSTILVVGHNGFGDFGLWDIDKRILVSKFSAPGTSVFHCVPAGMFRWQSKGEHNSKDLTDEIMNATKMWFSGMGENQIPPVQNKDMAVWLLISTLSDTDSQRCQSSGRGQANLARCWRLALLAKNMVIMGRTLDSGVAAVANVHGIFGRCDGLVYTWDLSTGNMLENLHHFKGTGVSCVCTSNTDSGALAIASGCQLLVYVQF
ncbi:uncharacterized protein LOC111396224 isoform X3 [Olea europaea subsp. europaea]|uniref:Uncharacterized protein LOC111396224 isoform X3 n=1 Tax=Olea europaea subsp. europaea TaxID=158383 RepID=A0A8S0SWJ3_OLEEU|nr:uncharacterized protein LOC111396224 isoform X3 [Olea europaea subsp. europaea]